MALQLCGRLVWVVYDGPAALEAARSFRPDAALLDIGMPGMDGWEVARRLREQPDTAGMLLIAITGYSTDEDRRHSREAGMNHHLAKPADFDQIEGLLETVAGRPLR